MVYHIIFVTLFFPYYILFSQTVHTNFEVKDSIVINNINKRYSIFSSGDYVVLQQKDKGKITIINYKTKKIIDKQHEVFFKDLIGFGFQAPSLIYLAFSACPRNETLIYSLNLIDDRFEIIKINKLYGHTAQFFIDNNHCLMLSHYTNKYFFIYDLNARKLIQKKKRLPFIFEKNVVCQYGFPYALLSFVNDSILSYHFIGQPTIYFMNKLHNYQLVTSVVNPNIAFNDVKLAFHFLPNPQKLNYSDVLPFLGNYNYFGLFKSFSSKGEKYFYQTAIFQEYDSKNKKFSVKSRFITIWNNNLELLKNMNFDDYICVTDDGTVLRPNLDELNKKCVIYDCGSIFEY
jgi:hypothetical protein